MLSFVIPVFQPDLDIFKKCLKSLADQALKDWEAVVVFDGEDKAAEAVLNSFNNKKFRAITIEHSGVQRARNEGAKLAKGEYLCLWDCDCIIEPEASTAWVNIFTKYPEIGFVYSGYKFLDEKGGIASEPFDPWLLKCGNYISTNFPMRRELFPGMDESLKSLQDWDMWLSIVEKGAKGHFIPGYAFSTSYPTLKSISGINCQDNVWKDRVKAVKEKHCLPDRKICVSAIEYKEEGIRLAKLIDADYKDIPNYKPNDYETVIQLGFSLHPKKAIVHANIFNQPLKKKIIFFTMADVLEINNHICLKAIKLYAERLNAQCLMYVEDMAAKRIMEGAGFKVSVMPSPIVNTDAIEPLPSQPRVLADITEEYRQVMAAVEHSCPDIKFDFLSANKPVKNYSAMLSLNSENTLTFNMKRMLVAGRNMISNVQAPYCGYVNDKQDAGAFVSELVEALRKRVNADTSPSVDYWKNALAPNELMEVLK